MLSKLRSKVTFLNRFFGLTHKFRIIILSDASQTLTRPQWFSIYLKNDLGATNENIGLVNAVQSGASLLLAPLGGTIGQRFSKKNLYLASLAIQVIVYLIAFLAVDWKWAILMSIASSCQSLVYPGISALIGEITDKATRTTVFAVQETAMDIVGMLNGPLQGFIAETVGLRPQYLLAIAGILASFFIFTRFFSDVEREGKIAGKEYRKQSFEEKMRWKDQIHLVFAKPHYRRNFIGLLQAGIGWRLFAAGLQPFINIYLYEDIGWSFLFLGFYSFASSFLTLALRIPFAKVIDKYHLRRTAFCAGIFGYGIGCLPLIFVRDPYLLAATMLVASFVMIPGGVATSALWYDAIPLEVYSIGVAFRNVIYGVSSVVGSFLGAYLWTNAGPTSSLGILFIVEIIRGSISLYFIRDIKDER